MQHAYTFAFHLILVTLTFPETESFSTCIHLDASMRHPRTWVALVGIHRCVSLCSKTKVLTRILMFVSNTRRNHINAQIHSLEVEETTLLVLRVRKY